MDPDAHFSASSEAHSPAREHGALRPSELLLSEMITGTADSLSLKLFLSSHS